MLKEYRKKQQIQPDACGQCKDGWPDMNLPLGKLVCHEGYGIRGVLQDGCKRFKSKRELVR